MKKLVYVLLLNFFVTANTFASPIKQACVTEPMSTSFIVYPQGTDFLTVRILHHNGAAYAPIYMGIVTANDLSMLIHRAEILKSLGHELDLQVSAKDCEYLDDFNFSCIGYGNTLVINGKKVRLWSLYSYQIVEKSVAGKYDYVVVNANIDVDGESFNIAMKYLADECINQFNISSYGSLSNSFFK